MKLAIISPIAHLEELSTLGTIQFALGHVKDLRYTEYFREHHGYTIMDNGSYELGTSVSFQDIIDAASNIKPDEIVAPDIQWNPEKSLESAKGFFRFLYDEGIRDQYKVMVVVWANSPVDFPNYYQEYLKLKPDVIGIGKWLATKFLARDRVVKKLKTDGIWGKDIEHHFLGCGYPGEAQILANEGRSMDTSGPIADALRGLMYEKGEMYTTLHVQSFIRSLDFNTVLSSSQLAIARHNCKVMLEYAAGE